MNSRKKIKVFTYGSLKKGYYNHKRLSFNKGIFLGSAVLEKAVMYNLGQYPSIMITKDSGNIVFGELYEIDEEIYTTIRNIEVSAGYKEIEVNFKNIKDKAKVFVMEKKPINSEIIKNGFWNKTEVDFEYGGVKNE